MYDADGVHVVPFVRSAHNYDMDAVSRETGLFCPPEEGMTQQSFAEECDINTIVRRFGLTGEMPGNVRPPEFGDFTDVVDFHTASNAVREANESFMSMPAELRYRFSNDPQRLMEFLADGKNRDEAVSLGLLNAPVVAAPPVVFPAGVSDAKPAV